MGTATLKTYSLPQCPGTSGFQTEFTGKQIKASPKNTAIHHAVTIIIRTNVVLRNAGVIKIRRRRIKTEIFVAASKEGCISVRL